MKKITKIIPFLLIIVVCTNCSLNKQSESSSSLDTIDNLFTEPTANLEIEHVEIFKKSVDILKNDRGIYEVRQGDTWMIISQKLFGNPLKWRQIQKLNNEFKDSSDLYVGAKLTYLLPEKPFAKPNGLPYLLKNADTLPKISKKVYGSKNLWDVIYFNNRDVIKFPDVIYSGFVIYYPEMDRVPSVQVQMAEMNFKVRGLRRPATLKNKKYKKVSSIL